MLAGYKGNRHSWLGGFCHCRQLLLHGISTSALHAGEDFNSINCVRHRRITRLTPSPSLCSYGPVEMGAAPAAEALRSTVHARPHRTAAANQRDERVCFSRNYG